MQTDALKSLSEGSLIRELYKRPEDMVVCFDLLMTRKRVASCKTPRQLKALAQQLQSLAQESLREAQDISKRTTHVKSFGIDVSHPVDFSSAVRSFLIQDTIILICDIHSAIEKGAVAE